MAIQGQLPWSNAGAGLFYGDPAAQYANAYTSALNLNAANYNNILKGYQQTEASQKAQQASVVAGYNQLRADVLNRLSGANRAAIQSVNDRYTADQGRASQQLVNRGLGNTTVQQSVNRGLAFDRAKAEVDARDRYAQNVAQYDTNIGLAREGFRGNAIGQNTALATRQLDWMNSVNSPYPDASAYMKIAEMRAKAAPPSYPNFGSPGGGGRPMGGGFGNFGGGGGGQRQQPPPIVNINRQPFQQFVNPNQTGEPPLFNPFAGQGPNVFANQTVEPGLYDPITAAHYAQYGMNTPTRLEDIGSAFGAASMIGSSAMDPMSSAWLMSPYGSY